MVLKNRMQTHFTACDGKKSTQRRQEEHCKKYMTISKKGQKGAKGERKKSCVCTVSKHRKQTFDNLRLVGEKKARKNNSNEKGGTACKTQHAAQRRYNAHKKTQQSAKRSKIQGGSRKIMYMRGFET